MSLLKRAFREAVRLVQPLVPHQSGGVTILAYHLIGAGTQSPVDLPIDVFREQLDELRQFARVCSLGNAVRGLQAGSESPRPTVVITFDDGFDNFRTCAWPLLKERQMPAALYVPVGFLEGTSGVPLIGADGLGPIEWGELRRLAADPLLTIGSHSWSHADLRSLGVDDLRLDLRRSRERLEDRTGSRIEHFCYPRAKSSRSVETEVGLVYRTGVVAGGRRNTLDHFHPLRLSRIPVRRDMPVRLTPIVHSAVCLEEWAASHARSLT